MTAEMRETAIHFKGAEDNRLAATLFEPNSDARGAPPVLFMHGGGQTRHSWNAVARDLARRGLRAVTVDARGHGDSEWVASRNYTFAHFRDDLLLLACDIRSRFGGEKVPPVLVGASMGGISALLADHAHSGPNELFTGIVLVDITPRMERTGVDRIMGFMSQNMSGGFDSVEDAADVIAAYLPHRPRPKTLDGLRKNLRQRDDGRWYWHWDPAFVDGPASVETGRGEREKLLLDAARGITVPTMLVRGSRSELVSEAAVEEFLDLVPHARFIDVKEAGHMVAGDKNDAFAAAVVDFLNGENLMPASAADIA